VKRTFISAAAVCAFTTVSHAGELSDIQAQAKKLREQNQASTRRIGNLEKRQRKLEARLAAQPPVVEPAGLKGKQEIADGLSALFSLQTGFNPQSGKLSDGLGSVAQNNGLSLTQQNAFGDSARNGQAFNTAAYAGLSSPIYGTLTYGRQSSLTSDGVVN
jgi:predicted porin